MPTSLAVIGRILYFRSVMPDFSLKPLVLAVAAEFQRHGMTSHLDSLRLFYRHYRAQKRSMSGQARPLWDAEMVIEWACLLRLPPFEQVYPVLGHGAHCPRCTAVHDPLTSTTVRSAWEGGWLLQCQHCDGRWLVLKE